MLFEALRRAGGFASLSTRIDCEIANLVTYAAGIVEVPEGIVASLRNVLSERQ